MSFESLNLDFDLILHLRLSHEDGKHTPNVTTIFY